MNSHPTGQFPAYRLRRLRQSPALRQLVCETHLHVSQLVLPLFVRGVRNVRQPIGAMPGVFQLSLDELVREAARAHGLPVKLHADQLSNMHGARLAARSGALSADHLEYTDDAGVAALAASGTVAVLLPGAYYFLRETQRPPIEALRRAGVPLAVATDCNPGTSPLTSMLAAMNLAAVLFGLSTEECLVGVTHAAARALGMQATTGTIELGKWCDLAIWNVAEPCELVNNLGARPLHSRIWHGEPQP